MYLRSKYETNGQKLRHSAATHRPCSVVRTRVNKQVADLRTLLWLLVVMVPAVATLKGFNKPLACSTGAGCRGALVVAAHLVNAIRLGCLMLVLACAGRAMRATPLSNIPVAGAARGLATFEIFYPDPS